MARVSRKNPPPQPAAPTVEALYNGAAYRRLSVEDARHRDRHTLENQKNIILDFLDRQPDIRLVDIYTDDGESGTNFDRPGFKRLMDDVRAGKINCIIVKDLSRFARDFREAGHYLEQIFPFLGVRFISINDNYDTAHPRLDNEGIAIPATNLINEMYARDISQKINSGLRVLRAEGKFVGSLAPYGYNKSPEDKHRLVIDPPAAEVMRNIFQWLLDGWSDYKIVQHLNREGIPTPSRYRYEQGVLKSDKVKNAHLWQKQTIKKLVVNPVYAGDMAQGRQDTSYFSFQRGPKPVEEWDVVKNTHEPVVSREVFDAVQQLLEKRRQQQENAVIRNSAMPIKENLLRGLLFCGNCGCTMNYRRERGGKHHDKDHWIYRYWCRSHAETGGVVCAPQNTSCSEITDAVLTTIRTQIAIAANLRKVAQKVWDSKANRDRLGQMDAEATKLRQKITRNGTLRRNLYERYMEALLTESEYLFAKEQYEQEGLALERQLTELLRQKNYLAEHLSPSNLWITTFLKYKKEMELTRPMLLELVERIDVYDGKRISITLKYADEYRILLDLLNEQMKQGKAVAV